MTVRHIYRMHEFFLEVDTSLALIIYVVFTSVQYILFSRSLLLCALQIGKDVMNTLSKLAQITVLVQKKSLKIFQR